jgi:hypothetical protein
MQPNTNPDKGPKVAPAVDPKTGAPRVGIDNTQQKRKARLAK